jgi:alpha-amylase/alpha-mannosidase (GH57 family)
MASAPRINLCLFWHQHQPSYYDHESGELLLPWVRLHSAKDYVDMALLGDRYPAVHQTINLVPSLIEQIKGYVGGTLTDTALRLSEKPADELTESERRYLLTHFFDANEQWMIRPYRRYRSLWRQRNTSLERCLSGFTPQDYRDLQVWFNLVWIDPIFRNDPGSPLPDLVHKAEGFTEEEKQLVLSEHRRLMAQVLPTHQRLQEAGVLEVTTTPFFHPILPLLCNSNIAQVCQPTDPLPSPPFRAPEDARNQVSSAIRLYEQEFGQRPRGMWPAEGSVSQEALALLVEEGIEWAASDESVLLASKLRKAKQPGNLYEPYQVETPAGLITLVFRDHRLSDLIGFEYPRSPSERAAEDFVSRLHAIAEEQDDTCTISVILDGENCWEHYPDDGHPFLDALYSRLAADPAIRCCTVSEAVESLPPMETVTELFPGSWVNRDFRIWIGGAEDNVAWEYLRQARDTLVQHENQLDENQRVEAWEHIYAAEASDWFWWYGDEHPSTHAQVFDRIFRARLARVYRIVGLDPPNRLLRPIRVKGHATPGLGGRLLGRPNLKGSSYFEWAGASEYLAGRAGGAMHRASYEVTRILYGVIEEGLALRLEVTPRLAHALSLGRCHVRLICVAPVDLDIDIDDGQGVAQTSLVDNVFSILIDLEKALTSPEAAIETTTLEFSLELIENGETIEHCPEEGVLAVPLPGPHLPLRRWFV